MTRLLKVAVPVLIISLGTSVWASQRSKRLASTSAASPLTPDQRAVHALTRLTFGPRPGDVARVKAMGVDAWIDQQLRPETIRDKALDTWLAQYPAMQLGLQQRIELYPPNPVVRAVENGRLPEPRDSVERSIYADQIARIQMRQQAKQTAQAANTAPAAADGNDQYSPSMSAQEDRIYHDLDAVKIINLPAAQRYQRIVAMKPDEFEAFTHSLNQQERQALGDGLTPQQREVVASLENPAVMIGGEVIATRLLRDVYSERQLQAVMADFWLNHFNVYLRKGPFAPWYLADYQDKVILPHAMGRFEDLLDAVAKSPAMLDYLDNASSTGAHSPAAARAAMNPNRGQKPLPGINENYGRELMELHTLGVNGGYTQQDVIEVARVLTGWTIDKPAQGGGFNFNPNRHEPGTKVVLGHRIHEGGEREGMEVLHILASSPATAHFLSLELAQRFVSDNPPKALVDRMAATYLKTGGQISEVLRTMFHSPEFWSESAYRAKVKTPEEFVLSAVRATGGGVERPAELAAALNRLGMPVYGCQTPNGYSWQAQAWVNTGDLVNRMNFALALAHSRAGTEINYPLLLGDASQTPDALESSLESTLLSNQLSQNTRTALLKEINVGEQPVKNTQAAFTSQQPRMELLSNGNPAYPPASQQAAAITGLLLGSPDFQRR